MKFQDETWKYAMSAIRDDGYLDSELARGSRALVYHQYALSALVTLREIRRALGLNPTQAEQRKLKLLADAIGKALCHPEEMSRAASAASQEKPGEWGFREIAAYGKDLMSPDWVSCGVPVRNYFDINNGGDQTKNVAVLRALSKSQ